MQCPAVIVPGSPKREREHNDDHQTEYRRALPDAHPPADKRKPGKECQPSPPIVYPNPAIGQNFQKPEQQIKYGISGHPQPIFNQGHGHKMAKHSQQNEGYRYKSDQRYGNQIRRQRRKAETMKQCNLQGQ